MHKVAQDKKERGREGGIHCTHNGVPVRAGKRRREEEGGEGRRMHAGAHRETGAAFRPMAQRGIGSTVLPLLYVPAVLLNSYVVLRTRRLCTKERKKKNNCERVGVMQRDEKKEPFFLSFPFFASFLRGGYFASRIAKNTDQKYVHSIGNFSASRSRRECPNAASFFSLSLSLSLPLSHIRLWQSDGHDFRIYIKEPLSVVLNRN